VAVFQLVVRDASPKSFERVVGITIRPLIHDCTGDVWFTDFMLQAGQIATGWIGNVSEIQWTEDG
jgi:hypothetical protein